MAVAVARDFRRKASAATAGILAAAAALVLGGGIGVLVQGFDAASGGGYLFAAGSTLLVLAAVAVPARRTARTLRALRRRFPTATIFLLRQVADLPYSPADFPPGHGWVATVADARGVSFWSMGRHPSELASIAWDALGAIVPHEVADDRGTIFVVNVEHPASTSPLPVQLGYCSGLFVGALGADDCRAVVPLVNAHRALDSSPSH